MECKLRSDIDEQEEEEQRIAPLLLKSVFDLFAHVDHDRMQPFVLTSLQGSLHLSRSVLYIRLYKDRVIAVKKCFSFV